MMTEISNKRPRTAYEAIQDMQGEPLSYEERRKLVVELAEKRIADLITSAAVEPSIGKYYAAR